MLACGLLLRGDDFIGEERKMTAVDIARLAASFTGVTKRLSTADVVAALSKLERICILVLGFKKLIQFFGGRTADVMFV